jgi:non-ribosomal peptide synthetase component E (peptide arylation enzyme)
MRKEFPDAPFKSTWHELALKRILRYAAEKGYDRIAWTTGEQQAARYDLSKHVDQVNDEGKR